MGAENRYSCSFFEEKEVELEKTLFSADVDEKLCFEHAKKKLHIEIKITILLHPIPDGGCLDPLRGNYQGRTFPNTLHFWEERTKIYRNFLSRLSTLQSFFWQVFFL